MKLKQILELNYKNYKKVAESYIEITELMYDLACANIFEMQNKYPDKIEASKKQIERLKVDIQKGDKLPPIIVQVNEYDEFVTVIDGFHRIIAYTELGIVRCFAVYVERLDN